MLVSLPCRLRLRRGGFGLSKAEVDQSSLTSALPGSAHGSRCRARLRRGDHPQRGVVGRIEQAKLQALAWANADTGSRGAITSMVEKQGKRRALPQFTASRESFDGVALYSGRGLPGRSGDWRMRAFKPL